MARAGYKPEPLPPIVGGCCTKHGETVTPIAKVCLSCHHDALDAAGFEWRAIGGLRADMGGTSGWLARLQEKAA